MTLKEFIDLLGDNPGYIIGYFIAIVLATLLTGWISKEDGYKSPWKYLYALLIYLVCIPGMFAVGLNFYVFLFERGRSIFNADIYTQILPIIGMFTTLWLMKRFINLDYIPGFHRLTGFMVMILATLGLMYGLDRMRIVVFAFMPAWVLLLIFFGILLAMLSGWRKVSR